jgi:DNA replicative helicase MCM subunit Mcm2 (Cdc46/Mcm family)
MTKERLAQYISYARKHINPKLTEEAARDLMSK